MTTFTNEYRIDTTSLTKIVFNGVFENSSWPSGVLSRKA